MLRLADFRNKKILIMGLGLHGGGTGTAIFFARLGSQITVTDLKSRLELALSIAQLKPFRNITYHLGGHRPNDFRTADYVIKGPGVADGSRFLKITKRAGVPVLSDVEIFFRLCPAQIIGVTGTKGKSTTATLLAAMLRAHGRYGNAPRIPRGSATRIGRGSRVWLGGNIRKSVLEFLPRVRRKDLVVLELSSFQLDSLKKNRVSPHIALITNIFPDHLNRYPSMTAYAASKANIFRFQKKGDGLFINTKDALLRRLSRGAPGRVIRYDPPAVFRRFSRFWPRGSPRYHMPNIAAAIAVARHLKVGERAIRQVLARFKGLPGRMQFVRSVRGVEFINDTTATNPGAAGEAVIATKRRIGSHGLHVIAGGYDKGLKADKFIKALRRHAASVIFLPGTATAKMKPETRNPKPETSPKSKIQKIFEAKTMKEAVRMACRNSRKGDVVLLSPGAASFGLFQHEFDRGEQFVRAVKRFASRTLTKPAG